MSTIVIVIIAVLVFSFLIFIHELGHFLAAKWAGIKVNGFSLGMGPAILSFERGGTLYALRLLPIGGSCEMEGELDDSEDAHAFGNVHVLKRIVVVVAGALMNILLGLLLMTVITNMQSLVGTTTIAVFDEGAASEAAGLRVGDVIYAIDGYRTHIDTDIVFALVSSRTGVFDFTVLREGERITIEDIPMGSPDPDAAEGSVWLDFKVYGEEKTPLNVLGYAAQRTWSLVRMVFDSVGRLITGQFALNDLAGPVGVGAAIGESASQGWESLLLMVSFITINLGVMNLLPIPALDGGRLVFLLIELVRRRPINPQYEGYVHFAGFVLLMGLILLVTFGDIQRLVTGG